MSTQPNNAVELLKSEANQLQFQEIMKLNGKKPEDVIALAKQEVGYLEGIAQVNRNIIGCTPLSVFLAVKAVIRQNLSLDPHAGLVYVKTRNVNVGDKNNANWQKVLEISPTANGLLSIARQCGRVLDHKWPEVYKDKTNGKVIGGHFEILKPSAGGTRWEKYTFGEDDIYRWQRASHKENARGYNKESGKPEPDAEKMNWANENYTNFKGGIDPEFLRAKMIRHSLKKLGSNQNEVAPGSINQKHVAVISAEAAMKESADDGFTHFEEVKESTDVSKL